MLFPVHHVKIKSGVSTEALLVQKSHLNQKSGDLGTFGAKPPRGSEFEARTCRRET